MRFAGTQMTNFMGDTMDFSKVANESILGRGRERQAAMQSEGLVANAGIKSVGAVQSAGYQSRSNQSSWSSSRSSINGERHWLISQRHCWRICKYA